jgi:hypothetical protein
MKRRWVLYTEFAAEHGLRERPIKKELLSLQALDTRLTEDLSSLFEDAVTTSLVKTFGEDEARAMTTLIGEKSFEDPRKLSKVLDSLFCGDSETLKGAIAREFCSSLHLLYEKMKRNPVKDLGHIAVQAPPLSIGTKGGVTSSRRKASGQDFRRRVRLSHITNLFTRSYQIMGAATRKASRPVIALGLASAVAVAIGSFLVTSVGTGGVVMMLIGDIALFAVLALGVKAAFRRSELSSA